MKFGGNPFFCLRVLGFLGTGQVPGGGARMHSQPRDAPNWPLSPLWLLPRPAPQPGPPTHWLMSPLWV